MQLTEIEKKLIVLALDPAAPTGEVEAASIKFVMFLRKRYSNGHDFVKDLESVKVERPIRAENLYGDFEFPFGKHKGKKLKQIPISYLVWALTSCDLFPPTKHAVQSWLEGKEADDDDDVGAHEPYWW